MRAWIRKRPLRNGGASFQVLYRRGGRAFRVETAGTFEARKHASNRKELVQGWLASGRDPRAELAAVENPPPRRTFATVAAGYEASRIDVEGSSRAAYGYAVAFWNTALGGRVIDEITDADVQAVINESDRARSTLRTYLSTLRQVFEFAKLEAPKVNLPIAVRVEEINPPEAADVVAILGRVSRRLRLPLILTEQCGLRIGEPVQLQWQDVDEQGCRLRLRATTTKRKKARFVPVPEWLMETIANTCPREDRTPTRRVFPGFSDDTARNAMTQACKVAGITHHSPHDLRHRRASLWVKSKPIADVAAWLGHAKKSMTLDTYSHVMIGGEVEPVELLALLLDVAGSVNGSGKTGRDGDAAVMTDPLREPANPHDDRVQGL